VTVSLKIKKVEFSSFLSGFWYLFINFKPIHFVVASLFYHFLLVTITVLLNGNVVFLEDSESSILVILFC